MPTIGESKKVGSLKDKAAREAFFGKPGDPKPKNARRKPKELRPMKKGEGLMGY